MKFHSTSIQGLVLVEPQPQTDERGFFARVFCPEEFSRAGIDFLPIQDSLSRNTSEHTLRGMHYQASSHAEARLVQVTRGAIYDVVIDLRRESASFGKWLSFELNETNANLLYIPEGCAHGFLTLKPETDVLYRINKIHVEGRAQGIRWDDPKIGIRWPAAPKVMSPADRAWPDFQE